MVTHLDEDGEDAMGHRRRYTLLATLLWAVLWAAPRGAGAAAEADPLLALVPAEAVGAALIDLRPESESLKVLAAAHTPEQAATLRAGLALAQQFLLAHFAPGVDLEKDVLPWLTRRVALCWLPVPGQKNADPLLLIETSGGTPAAAGFDQLVQAALRANRAAAVPPVENVPVWKLTTTKQEQLGANLGAAVAVTPSAAALTRAIRQSAAAAASAPPPPVAAALAAAPPGLLRFAMNPEVFAADPNGPAKALGLAGLGGALRFTPAGLVLEGALPFTGDQAPLAALEGLKPTFAESVAGLPRQALAALVAARPSQWVHASNIPLFDALAGGFLGPEPVKVLGPALGPLLSDLLGQEVAFGLLPDGEGLSWLAVFTSGRPNDLPGMVEHLTGLGGGTAGVAWTPAPLGENPGWVLKLALRPNRPPTTIHLALLGPRLVAAGSRAALEAGATTLAGEQPPAAEAAWLTANGELLGQNPLLKAGADVHALLPLLAARLARNVSGVAPYAARLAQTLLVGCTGVSAALRVEGGAVRAVGIVALDYPKLAASGGLTMPTIAVLAAGAATDARKKAQQPPPAPEPPAAQQQ
jgi:hypothetical protein